jgi:hypothetical protein
VSNALVWRFISASTFINTYTIIILT